MSTSAAEEPNAYELLRLEGDATEGQIKTAYRQRSLKVHPDRHPNNPEAAAKFHDLNQAYELLLDPIRKAALDASLKIKNERKLRFAAFDSKRKAMTNDLEERERVFKRAKVDKAKEEKDRLQENERIKEEGRRMREEREKEAEKSRRAQKEPLQRARPELGPLDTTVKLRYPLATHPTLTTTAALTALLSPFGPVDAESIVLSMKPNKKTPSKPPKFATALVPFKQVGDAFAALCTAGKEQRGLGEIEISWASGQEPAVLEWLKQDRSQSPPSASASATTRLPDKSEDVLESSFSSFPSSFSFEPSQSSPPQGPVGLNFESITLMRLRQAERQKLEQAIIDEEAEESQQAGV